MDPEIQKLVEEAKRRGYSNAEIKAKLAEIGVEWEPIELSDIGRSAFQGLTLDWGDELVGLVDKKARDEMRANDKAFTQAHPWISGGARLAGGLVLPGGAAVKGAAKGLPALKAVGQAFGIGAATGAAAGAGSGESLDDRGGRALAGGLAGGVLGAAVPAASAAVRGFSPAARASDRLQAAIQRSGGVQALLKRLQAFQAGGRGDDVMLGDISKPMQQATDFAANASEDAAERIGKVAYPRQENMANRVLDDVTGAAGSPHADQIVSDLEAGTRAWAEGPAGYGGLRASNPQIIPAMAESFQKLIQSPAVKRAWEQAQEVGLIGPMPKSGAVSFDVMQGTLERLGNAREAAFGRRMNDLAFRLKAAHDELAQELEAAVPGYKAVATEYATRKGLERAVRLGEEAWHEQDTRGLQKLLGAMSRPEQEKFREGLASKMIAELRSAKTNKQVARDLVLRSQATEEKLNVVFGGPRGFRDFLEKMQLEDDMAQSLKSLGGSATARRLAAQGADPAEMVLSGVTGGPAAAAASGARSILPRVLAPKTATQLAPFLTTQGASPIEQLLMQWAQRPPRSLAGGPIASQAAPAAIGGLTGGLLGQ